jgi:hypothetical protein
MFLSDCSYTHTVYGLKALMGICRRTVHSCVDGHSTLFYFLLTLRVLALASANKGTVNHAT